MDQQRPPPAVTIRDPARPAAPADVLGSGDDERRPGPAGRWRGLAVAALGVAVLALAVAVPELRERRAAAEAQRLAASVDLAALVVGVEATDYDTSSARVRLQLDVGVRNRGSRDVAVLGVEHAEVVLDRPVTVPAGGRGRVALTRGVACSATQPPDALAGSTLLLRVRTSQGETTEPVKLLAPAGDTAALRGCGFLPLEQTVDVRTRRELPAGGEALLLEITASGERPLSVTDVLTEPWLRRDLQTTDAQPQPLPVRLAVPAAGARVVTPLRLVLGVTDCAAARTQLRTGALTRLRLLVKDSRGRVATKPVDVERLVRGLVERSC